MPQNANWVKCDEIKFFTTQLELHKSDDERFMRFILKDTFHPVDVITSGNYISFKYEDEARCYAFSQSSDPNIRLFKIYSYAK